MATKTLILRPISATTVKVGSYNKTTNSVVPSDTATDAYHTLLSEEVADNNSTCIVVGGGYCIDVGFDPLPQDMQVSSIKIIATANTPSDTVSGEVLTYEFYNTVDGASQLIESLRTSYSLADLSSGYTRLACESSLFTQEIISTPSLSYIFRLQTPEVNIKVYVTQIYAEIEYETSDVTTVYCRENGTWNAIPCKIYQKINNEWKISNTNIFVEDEIFNLNSQ